LNAGLATENVFALACIVSAKNPPSDYTLTLTGRVYEYMYVELRFYVYLDCKASGAVKIIDMGLQSICKLRNISMGTSIPGGIVLTTICQFIDYVVVDCFNDDLAIEHDNILQFVLAVCVLPDMLFCGLFIASNPKI
jgi:hypothetical protein